MTTNSPFNLKQLFSIAQYQQLKTEVILPASTAKRSQWILSRGLCLYELIDLRTVSREDRAKALKFQISKKAVFNQTGYHVEWKKGLAMTWLWDKESSDQSIQEQGIEVFEVIPETVLRERTKTDGLVLLPSLDNGYDLQFWSQEILLSSCWFANMPTSKDISVFIKGIKRISKLAFKITHSEIPALTQSNLTQQKWSGSDASTNLFKGFNFEPALAITILICSLVYIQWQTMTHFKLSAAVSNIENAIDDAFDRAGPIADARDKSLLYQQQLQHTFQLIDFPDQIKLLATFGQIILDKQGSLKEWRFNLNKLELTIETNSNNALEYVNDIQALKIVTSVTTETSRKPNQIKIIVTLAG